MVMLVLILKKATLTKHWAKHNVGYVVLIGLGVGIVVAILVQLVVIPKVKLGFVEAAGGGESEEALTEE